MTSSRPSFSDEARFQRAENTSWSKLGDEALILDLDKRRSHRLTGAALSIWESLLDGLTLEACALKLTQTFEVTIEQARQDCHAMAAQLCGEGVLREVEATKP